MLNSRVILINAMSRGGSNILWNIMQSHPVVCSPIRETGDVLHPEGPGLHRVSRLFYMRLDLPVIKRYVDKKLFSAKMENISHPGNRYKTEDELYGVDELRNAVLCLKSLNDDIRMTDLFYSMYNDIHAIGLVRNGYAVCEGWVRRGERARVAGRAYARYMGRIVEDSERLHNYRLVKFEQVLTEPFETATSLYDFCELEPRSIGKLRLKSKQTMGKDGRHTREYERTGDKYWLDHEAMRDFLDAGVDSLQAGRLNADDRKSFEREAKPVLDYLGYL
jgi:hypothetical protein